MMYELVIIMVAIMFTGIGIVVHGYILHKKQLQQDKIIKAIKKMVEEELKKPIKDKDEEVNQDEQERNE